MRDNLSFKNIFQREMKLASYIIVCVTIVVISLSYAMFFQVNDNSENQEVVAGDLIFTYTNGGEISNTNTVCFLPMNEEEASLYTSECSYKFSVRNTGSLKANYTIKLLAKTENTIELNKVKVILKKQNGETLESVFTTPKLLSEITDGILANEEMDSHQNIVYSIQLYLEDNLYQDGDENKNISFQIEGSGIVHEENPVNTDMNLATNYIKNLARTSTEIVSDDTKDNNLRYIGANPSNYVYFNCDDNSNPTSETCELWRIIGVMNNIDDGTGKKETRIKLIRNESIGNYSWDTSESTVNSGYGINEWSQADAMKLLNPGHESETVGGSLYWNRGSGTCYNDHQNATASCDFTTSGLKETAKTLIGKAVWNTGANGTEERYNTILTSKFYELERSKNTGRMCEYGEYCNDNVTRTTTWTGHVGLMYPSDYGYATSGGITTSRETCLNTVLFGWNNLNISDCKTNDWLYKVSTIQWTLSPDSGSSSAFSFNVNAPGLVFYCGAFHAGVLLPVFYLKTNVKIVSGEGSVDSPFVLSL